MLTKRGELSRPICESRAWWRRLSERAGFISAEIDDVVQSWVATDFIADNPCPESLRAPLSTTIEVIAVNCTKAVQRVSYLRFV